MVTSVKQYGYNYLYFYTNSWTMCYIEKVPSKETA